MNSPQTPRKPSPRLPHSYFTPHFSALTPVLAVSVIALTACTFSPLASAATKVAIIADQGVGSGAKAVLSLIAKENVDIVLIQGDLGYEPDTAMQWDTNITNALGRDFPVLGLVGNHEDYEWPLYQRLIEQRVDRADGLSCNGDIGVKASCTFKDLQVVQVAPGITRVAGVAPEDDYDGFIRSSFKNSESPWRICAWHKNQYAMQVYSKPDETGWGVYDACLDSGAMIAMGHAHTYSRTFLMTDYEAQSVAHRNKEMTLEPGRSFAVVSGLGGRDIKSQKNDGDWFASAYTQSQGATHGALFCTLEMSTADCYFKAINGAIPDQFSLKTGTGSPSVQSSAQPSVQTAAVASDSPSPSTGAGVFQRSDKDEYRWIDRNSSGQWASSWISESCATALGGAQYSGNWNDLMAMAPHIDTATGPCDGSTAKAVSPPPPDTSNMSGYVFSRTDKDEFRWIDTDSTGQVGNIWIDEECALKMGGASASGDWHALNAASPGFDTVANPCY